MLQLPAMGLAMAVAPAVFGRLREERGWGVALAYASLWPLNLLPVFVSGIGYPYHMGGIAALAVLTFALALRPGAPRIAGERALAGQLLLAVVVGGLLVTGWLHNSKTLRKALAYDVPELVLSCYLAGYVAVVLIMRRLSCRRHFVVLCCSLALVAGATATAVDYGGRERHQTRLDNFHETRAWAERVAGAGMAGQPVLYLASARGAYALRAQPACRLVYSTMLKQWRKRAVVELIEPLASARWYRECAASFRGDFIFRENSWFKKSSARSAGLLRMMRRYRVIARHGHWQLYCRRGSRRCR
ncbi:MAG: hypothetical protein JRI23_14465 [Deltaproteobacteria bacterium]|nr:hypothetical protein [Deltaproteobacteria bacterium]MBW2532949.1 hypothetical protein [Deltaproteobacteria bacterium]